MIKTTVVVYLLLLCPGAFASSLNDSINRIESDWAISYYLNTPDQQKVDYPRLLKRAEQISKQFPDAAEPKIWQAILLSANAAYESPIAALNSLDNAKRLLEEAISTAPDALEGAAYVTLGTLYYMVPGWPVSFGDNEKAEQLLRKALQINPDGIDANYFYGDYLASINKLGQAEKYFKNALKSPIRPEQMLADLQLQKDASAALAKAKRNIMSSDNSNILTLFSSTKYKSQH